MLAILACFLAAQLLGQSSAERLYEQGQFQKAASAYTQLLNEKPDDVEVRLRLANCHNRLKQYDAAELHYRQVLSSAPDQKEALIGIGGAFIGLGRPRDAARYLVRALRKDPEDRLAKRTLGHAFQEANSLVPGERILRELLSSDPHDWESSYYLGLLLFQNGYYPAALEALEDTLDVRPDHKDGGILLALTLSQLGRVADAETEFKKLLADPAMASKLLLNLGYAQLLYEDSRPESALPWIDRAVEADPKSGVASFWRGRILYALGMLDEARIEAERSVELSGDSSFPRALLVRIYRIQGREEDAARQTDWLRKYEQSRARGRPR